MSQVEDLYGLTPTQAGMLWAALDSPDQRRYHEQLVIEMNGDLDPDSMIAAWQAVVARLPALRTAFHWESIATPVQAVHRDIAVEVEVSRLGDGPGLEAILAADRQRGFDLSVPPLMRLHLVEVGHREWRMVWSFSHLILDGWSLPLVLGDVLTAYAQLRRGERPELEPRPAFRDFVAWMVRRDPSAALDFWAEHLQGIEDATPLGIDRRLPLPEDGPPPPLVEREWVFEPDLAEAVTELCRRARVTLGTVLFGAWALVLSRYSGRDDVVFGTTASGRPADLPGAGDMVGIFITTVPVRIRIDHPSTAAKWLSGIQEAAAAATDAHHVSLTDIRARTGLRGDQPLFESLLVLENYPASDADTTTDLSLGQVRAVERTEYPLVLVASPAPSPAVKVAVDPDRIDAAAAARLLGHLRHALVALAADPDAPVGEVDVVGEEESDLLASWGRGAEPGASSTAGRRLTEVVAAQAQSRPAALAVTGAAGELSYGELVTAATALAASLQPGAFVGVCAPRGPALAIGAMATAVAGASHVLLDPAWPDARLAAVADQVGLVAVITSTDQTARLRQLLDVATVGVLEAGTSISPPDQSGPPPTAEPGADQPAYVVMTSGSTGEPKAVTATSSGLANLVDWHLGTYGLTAGERAALVAAPGFDASIWELWPALVAGATLCVPPDHLRSDPEGLCDWMTQAGVDVAYVPTPLVDAVLGAHGRWPPGGRLRFVLTGGDALLHGVTRPGGPTVVNHYGPSESTVVSTAERLGPDQPQPPPIGRPIKGVRAEIRDSRGRLCPIGATGELWVSGIALSSGYLGRPDLTAERFVDGWYRSGDLCRWNHDGSMEFVGRNDDQVKVRGVRIELGEVEAALAAVPGVAQAAAARRGDRLVAWVTGDPKGPPPPADIRQVVAQHLPPAFVPTAVGLVERFPLTVNGKVDRDALVDPSGMQTEAGGGRPMTPTEELVAAIWREVLGVEVVGPDTDFFDLGGHSLSATRVASRLRSTFGVEAEVGIVFDHPSLRGLSAHLDAGRRESLAAPIRPRHDTSDLPLSFAQQRLWFLDQLEPEAPTHNTGAALLIDGPLDLDVLQGALDTVIDRHEALRTTFPERSGRPYQRVHDQMSVPIAFETRQDAPLEEIRQMAWDGVREPFDLERGPLLRVKVVALGPGSHALLLYEHHIVSDGWSMSVLVQELSELYTAALENRAAQLPELAVQYADYALWQREWLSGDRLERELAWWREHLAGAPPVLDLPLDRPRTPLRSHDGASVALTVDDDVARGLVQLCGKRRTTLFMGLMAALSAVLGRVCGTDDVVVGTPVANRGRPEVEHLTGFFVNTLALRTRLDGEPTFSQLLDRVRTAALEAYAHQDLPFEKLVEELAPPRDLRTSPLFQVMLDVTNQSPVDWKLAGLAVRSLEASPELAPFDLTVEAAFEEGSLHLSINYATALFDEVTVRSLGDALVTFLAAAVADPDAAIGALPVVGEVARHDLDSLGRGPDLPADRPSARQAIATAAGRTPDAAAIRWEGRTTTYADLMGRVAQIAEAHREEGVEPGQLVALCNPRGPEAVAALLAAWEVGASPLLLDPAWPEARREAATEEAGIAEGRRSTAGTGLAYCICTSGSTGRPKVVAVAHDNLAATMAAWEGAYAAGPEPQRLLSTAGIAFDVFIADVVRSLGSGATLVLCPEETSIDPPRLAELIVEERIDHLNLVPSTARALSAYLSSTDATLGMVRMVIVGAEAWTGADLERGRAAFPTARLVGAYGVSEAAVDSAWFEAAGRKLSPQAVVPLGRPLAGVRLTVVDGYGRPLPRGASGELWITGPAVSSGYLGREDLTAQRFSGEGGSRTYRTGDLVRWSSGGELEFLGRIDDQVQVRGQRVEPAEVEAVLSSHPDVIEAAVVLHNDILSALIVARPGATVAPPAIRAHAQAQLPLGMVPSRYRWVPSLPRGATGKLDRRALADLEEAAPPLGDSVGTAPRTAAEEEVAEVWAGVLGLTRVGIDDNFFDLGGHSMLAAEVVAGVKDRFGVDVPLRQLFESPTVAAMAQLVGGPG